VDRAADEHRLPRPVTLFLDPPLLPLPRATVEVGEGGCRPVRDRQVPGDLVQLPPVGLHALLACGAVAGDVEHVAHAKSVASTVGTCSPAASQTVCSPTTGTVWM